MKRGKRFWARVCLAGALFLLPAAGIYAQSVSDDIEQLVMDVQKLTELKQILSEMYQAYTIVQKGYEDIKSLSQGTFSLHKAFLDGLLAVSPAVGKYVKVADIVSKETRLVQEYQSASKYFSGTGRFTAAELDYFLGVYEKLFEGSLTNVNELVMVVTAGQLRMSDAERLSAIDRIDRDITNRLGALRALDNTGAVQGLQRAKIGQDIGTVSGMYGIGP